MEENRLWPTGPYFRQGAGAKLTTDSVLLADFVRNVRGKGADLGCASGILMLLLLEREPGITMTGVEIEAEAAGAALENLRHNGLETRGEILCMDLRKIRSKMKVGSYEFAVFNPPYYDVGRGKISETPERAGARSEVSGSLEDFCNTAVKICRSDGRIFCCYKPEQIIRMIDTLRENRAEVKRIRFVHHSANHPANLVLIEARKDGNPGLRIEKPLILFDENGRETDEYRMIYHRT